jgi:hypothetical protein
VKRAKGKPVRLLVRPSGLMPLNMGGLDSDEHVSKPKIETADSAAVLISSQHAVSELRTTHSDDTGVSGKIDSDRVQNVLMQCFREIGGKQVCTI